MLGKILRSGRRYFGADPSGPARSAKSYLCEPLENRRLLSAVNLGALIGRAYRAGEVINGGSSNTYTVKTNQPGNLTVLLSRFGIRNDISLRIDVPSTGKTVVGTNVFIVDGTLSAGVDVPADTCTITVTDNGADSANYTIAVATDFVGPKFIVDGENWADNSGRDFGFDFGTLKDNPGANSNNDFVGFFDGSDRLGSDSVDMYEFTVPLAGAVKIAVTQTGVDPNGGAQSVDGTLYRNDDHDGFFEPSEIVGVSSIRSSSGSISFNGNFVAGRYALVMQPVFQSLVDISGFNYHIDIDYKRPDTTGNSLPTARNIGTLISTTQTFNEYLSSDDPFDIYTFSTVAGGPFVFDAIMSGLAAGTDFDVDLIKDINHDGLVEAGDPQTFSSVVGTFSENITKSGLTPATTPGTYFVRVQRRSGEGPYQLSMSLRNNDAAGNTLDTATNIGNLLGRTHLSDSVSATDPADVYKFILTAAATLTASFPATATGTNADLDLLQVVNGTTSILAVSINSNNAGESLSRSLAAGTYFLRVSRVSGTPGYDMTVTADTAGSTPATARPMTLTGNNASTIEFIGPDDTKDFYKLNVSGSIQLNTFLSLFGDTFTLSIGRDSNGNNALDASEIVLKKTIATAADARQIVNLSAPVTKGGTTFLVLVTFAGTVGSNYGIVFATAPTDNAGNTPADARNIGTLGAAQSFNDFVGDGSISATSDVDDFYRFTLGNNGPYQLSAQIAGLTADADLELFRDVNFNQLIDSGERLAISSHTGTTSESISQLLTVPGTYYLHVLRKSGNVNYTLTASAASLDSAGNTLAIARDLGALTDTTNSGTEFVGSIDSTDFYRFSVAAPSELLAQVSNQGLFFFLDIIRDVNGNGLVDPGDTIASSFSVTNTPISFNGVFLPVAGTYFARVRTFQDSNYNLSLTFSSQTPFGAAPIQIDPNNVNGTRIEFENFDNGGEGVAYHDATPLNDNGVFRTNESVEIKSTADPQGGAFRISTTAVGEFLEYTVNVAGTASYDFDFRVASNHPGAAFHLEVDGVDVTGRVDIPVPPSGFDAMQTITKTAIPLTVGPHILRLALDGTTGLDNGFAGSYNFMTVRRTPSTPGTFAVTAPKNVHGGDSAKLALQWTVPPDRTGWRVLKTVDFRLRDSAGTVIWIRFDEAANTFSVFNDKKGKFGPAKKVGSHGVLSTRFAQLHLKTSSVQADGPTDHSVVLTFDIRFKKKQTRHRHLFIEAAATDDLGNHQGFERGGAIDVV